MAVVAREHGWHTPKSLDSDENFKPEHTLFCPESKFVAIYALFWRSLGKKSAFLGQKQRFLGKKFTITWYIMHIMTKTFVAIFALLLTSTTLLICMPSYRLVGVFHWQITVKDTSEQISDLRNMLCCDWLVHIYMIVLQYHCQDFQ